MAVLRNYTHEIKIKIKIKLKSINVVSDHYKDSDTPGRVSGRTLSLTFMSAPAAATIAATTAT
jgi:hypothetical protein